MILYFLTILTVVILLVVLAQLTGIVKPLPEHPPAAFWISIGTVLFLGLAVSQIP